MKLCWRPLVVVLFAAAALTCHADDSHMLADALTLHASFESGLDADFSRGDRTCYVREGGGLAAAAANDDVTIAPGAGRFGNALHFTRKSRYWPLFKGTDVLNYNPDSWSASVSLWLRLNPDKDLEPGYCDPVQIVGDGVDKGFVFLEWSKDHTPRFFRYAVRPLDHIWNPDNLGWEEIPAEKRPMVQVEKAPFSAEAWTHVVFSMENVNDESHLSTGKLYINGELVGTIEGWDLTLGWDPEQVRLVLGASYVGHLDDLAVFNRALTNAEVQHVYQLKNGVRELHAK